MVGLGEHWIRKRYQDRDRSELELASIERIRKALETRQQAAPDDAIQSIIEQFAAAHLDEMGLWPLWMRRTGRAAGPSRRAVRPSYRD